MQISALRIALTMSAVTMSAMVVGPVSASAAVAAHASPAAGLLYERTLMSDADARCHLFAPVVGRALAASRDEARGAALRAGDGEATLDATAGRAAAKAAAVDCRSPALQTAAARLRAAYADYAKTSTMRFAGLLSAWRAERPDPRLKGERWRLVEQLPGTGGWVLFGSVSGAPALLDARRGVPPAAGARLIVRDPSRWSQPILGAGAPPPEGLSKVFIATSRAPAERTLWPAGATGATLYRFPPQALDAVAALDPRESGRVELVYPAAGRERIYAAPVEVGDLAAARAFLAARP